MTQTFAAIFALAIAYYGLYSGTFSEKPGA